MTNLTLVAIAAPEPNTFGFTSRDLISLTLWLQRSDAHGYRRILIEGGSGNGGPEDGSYVLIYSPMREWASWGIARSGPHAVVWHCGTGADLGRFTTMLEALDSLPPVTHQATRRAAAAAAMHWPSPSKLADGAQTPMEPPCARPRLTLVHSA